MLDERFRFHAFGETAEERFVACDGLVGGAGLHLSHWEGNRTPERYKRDTSTESALAFAREAPEELRERLVTNNHFDADGVLSVWALVEPERAREHEELIVAAAVAGDFDEWPDDDRGLRLEAAVRALGRRADGDRDAYGRVLPELGALAGDLDAREDLWGAEWQRLIDAERAVAAGALEATRVGRIALFHHRPGVATAGFSGTMRAPDVAALPGPVLSRHAPAGADRWLLAFEHEDGAFSYQYERPRHAWADTVVRPRIAPPGRNRLRAALSSRDAWAVKGGLGMTGLLRTERPIADPPERIAEALAGADRE
jgi:hypothetical protein